MGCDVVVGVVHFSSFNTEDAGNRLFQNVGVGVPLMTIVHPTISNLNLESFTGA
jgi:hypothetical protein